MKLTSILYETTAIIVKVVLNLLFTVPARGVLANSDSSKAWAMILNLLFVLIKAKFHYAVQLASRSATSSWAGSRATSELGEDLRVHVVCVFAGQIQLRCPARDQLASRSATSSRAGHRELVAEQDSVMEYGLNRCATKVRAISTCRDSSNLSATGL